MSTGSMDCERVLARLDDLLREISKERGDYRPVDHDATLPGNGIDSLTLIALLGAAEKEFAVTWRPDIPATALSSLRSIAGLLVELGEEGRASNPLGD